MSVTWMFYIEIVVGKFEVKGLRTNLFKEYIWAAVSVGKLL